MDILVVGGTGFVGSHLCRELHGDGHDVTAFSRHPETSRLPADVDTIAGNVTATDSVMSAVAGRDAVVNLVALSPLYKPTGGSEMHSKVHLGGTEQVFAAAEEHDCEFVTQMSALGADPNAATAYLRAKGRAEAVAAESSVTHTIFRPSVVFGDGGEFISFTKTVTTPYVTGLPGGGKTRFQPLWVGDLVSMLAAVFASGNHRAETYNVGGPEVLTLGDVTRLAYRASGTPVRVLPVPMALVSLGARVVNPLSVVPFGRDQYRSLRMDNTLRENDIAAFDLSSEEQKTLAGYLGVTHPP